MQSTTIQYEFDCDEETLWKASMYDEQYSRKLYLETLRFPRWCILEQTITEDGLTRRVDIRPRVDHVPGTIKKMFGDQFGYVEEGQFDRKSRRYSYRMIPTVAQDKSRIVGSMYTRPREPGGCVRIVELEIDISIMMVGRLIETRTIEDTRATHETIAAFTRSYLKQPSVPAAP